ncbi:MAG: DUF4349 domain-containing protein [Myxococcota bacterium]
MWRRCVWLMAALMLIAGCAKRAPEAYGEFGDYADEADYEAGVETIAAVQSAPMAARGRAFGGSVKAAKKSSRPRPSPPPSAAGPGNRPSEPNDAIAPEKPAAKRMVFYEASTMLRVPRVDEAVDTLTQIAKDQGGFVERVDQSRVAMRVPVARFKQSLAAVQAIGDVLSENIQASDVTEAFQDVSLRLDTATATRDRLVELLAKATEENERLQLIRQIQRLTDQIDQMQSQATTLSQLAALSRIVVTLQPRQALTRRNGANDSKAFRWIRQLSPFGNDVVRTGKKLVLDVPDGMVRLDLKGAYVAEAPDGSRIWAGRLATNVRSDAAFWIDAIKGRLSKDFESATVETVGAYTTIRFVQRDDSPYTWLIAVKQDGAQLHIVEAWMSSPEQTQRYLDAVRGVLKSDGGVL